MACRCGGFQNFAELHKVETLPHKLSLHEGDTSPDGPGDDGTGDVLRACLVAGTQNLGSCRKSDHDIENPVTQIRFHFGSVVGELEKVHEINALWVQARGTLSQANH